MTGFRTAVVAVGAGVVAGFGLFYTDRNFRHTRELFEHVREKDREQADLTREGQMTDRYATAIGLIAAPELTKRLGGIYALERVMRDSPKDHATVVEVLAAFIREHAPAPGLDAAAPADDADLRPAEHVQAALTVLGRRPVQEEPFRVDLRRTDLRGADLRGAHLHRARLQGSRLESADLSGSNLEEAELGGARMSGVHLTDARLDQAELTSAILDNAYLTRASLVGAGLAGASLRAAFLEGADLREALLIGAHLEGALLNGADLRRARMSETHLSGALLINADLREVSGYVVHLDEATLYRSNLCDALLHRTDLKNADLREAVLAGTQLDGSQLEGANFSTSVGLTLEQILAAWPTDTTQLPDELSASATLQAHISGRGGGAPPQS